MKRNQKEIETYKERKKVIRWVHKKYPDLKWLEGRGVGNKVMIYSTFSAYLFTSYKELIELGWVKDES